jgi:DNA-3-methyladenine glycosylase II
MKISEAIAHLNNDLHLQKIIRQTPMPVFNQTDDVYYSLLESIVSQQLSVKVADIIFNRFRAIFPDEYPHAEQLIAIPSEQLRSIGLSNQKAGYLQNVAHYFLENQLHSQDWSTFSDEAVLQSLTKIKGVGPWTVQMILMFTLGRPDVFPVDDLGIQQAMQRLFNLSETGKDLKIKMIELSEPWRPYRTVACRFLWRWKDTSTN